MRNYKKYMDGVEVSPELHERLSHLTPAKGPAPWKKYGALAAALVLVVGAGALGLSRLGATDAGRRRRSRRRSLTSPRSPIRRSCPASSSRPMAATR